MLRRAIGLYVDTLAPDDPRLVQARMSLAAVLLSRERYAEAENLLDQAAAVFQSNPRRFVLQLGTALSNLSVTRTKAGDLNQARNLAQRAVEITEEAFGAKHPLLVGLLNNLGTVAELAGDRERAAAAFEQALNVAASRLPEDHPTYADVLLNYADLLRRSGQNAAAKGLEAKARSALKAHARSTGIGITVDVADFPKNP